MYIKLKLDTRLKNARRTTHNTHTHTVLSHIMIMISNLLKPGQLIHPSTHKPCTKQTDKAPVCERKECMIACKLTKMEHTQTHQVDQSQNKTQ